MKNIARLFIVLLLITFPIISFAEMDPDWPLTATHRVTRDTTIYDWERITEVATSGDLTGNEYTDIFTPRGIIPEGTYIIVTSSAIDGKREILGYGGGRTYLGWIDENSYRSVMINVKGKDGKVYKIPEAAYKNYNALKKAFGDRYDEETLRIIAAAERIWGSSGNNAGKKEAAVDVFAVTWTDEAEEVREIELLVLGTAYSTIMADEEELVVPTSSLAWPTDAEEGQRIAAIDATRTGKATMHSKSGGKGSVVKKVDTNQLVLVLEAGKKYSRIWCEGKEGYVLTSALRFLPVIAPEEAELMTKGQLSYKGRIRSSQSINVRAGGSRKSRVVETFRAGTVVVIFGETDGWVEIEAEGYRVFVQQEYLTVE